MVQYISLPVKVEPPTKKTTLKRGNRPNLQRTNFVRCTGFEPV